MTSDPDTTLNLKPPYFVFDGKQYPFVEELTNREIIHMNAVANREGFDTSNMPEFLVAVVKVFVAARRVDPNTDLTIDRILDGPPIEYVGVPIEADGNGARPPTVAAAAKGQTSAGGGHRTSVAAKKASA